MKSKMRQRREAQIFSSFKDRFKGTITWYSGFRSNNKAAEIYTEI